MPTTPRHARRRRLALLLPALLPSPSLATNYTWTGNSTLSPLFSATGNWSPSGQPTAVDNVTFASSFNNTTAIPVVGAQSVNAFTVNTATPFSLEATAGASLTINGPISAGGPQANTTANVTFNVPVILPNTPQITLTASSVLTFNSDITLQGAASPNISFTGSSSSINLNAKTALRGHINLFGIGAILNVNHESALNQASIHLSPTTVLQFNAPTPVTVTQTTTVTDGNIVPISPVTFSAPITIIGASATAQFITFNSTSTTISGGVNGAGTSTLALSGGTYALNFLGTFPGTVSVAQSTATLSSVNSAPNVSSFRVTDFATLVLPPLPTPTSFTRPITLTPNASISIPAGSDFHPAPGQITPNVPNTNPGIKTGAGTLTFNPGVNPTIRRVAQGALRLTAGIPADGSPFTVDSGATLFASTSVQNSVLGPGTLTLTGITLIGSPTLPSPPIVEGTLSLAPFSTTLVTNTFPSPLASLTRLGEEARLSSVFGLTVGVGKTLAMSSPNVSARIDGPLAVGGTVAGPTTPGTTLTLADNVTGIGTFTGNLTLQKSFSPTGPVSANTLTLDPTALASLSTLSTITTLLNHGQLHLTSSSHTIHTLSGPGSLTLSPATSLTLPPNSGPSTIGSLILLPSSTLDLTNNPLTLQAPDPYLTLLSTRHYLSTARLTSSTPDPTNTHSLGYLQTPAGILIQLTPTGDANLNGTIDPDDFTLLDHGFASQGSLWQQGDFNYDGAVTPADYLLLDSTYAKQQGGLLSPALLSHRQSQFGTDYVSTLLTTIPEPTLPLSAVLYPLSSVLLKRRRPLPV